MRTPAPTRLLPVAVVGLALGAAACGVGPRAASGDVTDGPATGSAIEVVATDNAFDPSTLQLEPGSQVTVEVTNEGDQAHNLVVEDLDLSTGTIDPGQVVSATITVPEGGVDFVCTFHPGMAGRIEAAA